MIVAATSAGALYYTRQLPPPGQGAEWQDWRRVPAPQAAGGLAAIRDHERRVELYFRQRGENHLIRLVEAGDTSDTNMDWSEPADLGVPYIGRPAVGVDARGNVMLAILERPGGALWLVERGKPAKLDALAASPPAMSVIGDTVYIVARAAGAPQRYQVLSRHGGAWAANLTLDGVPASGGGPFKAVAARPADLPNLGAGGQNHAVVLRLRRTAPARWPSSACPARPRARPNPLPRTESAHVVLASPGAAVLLLIDLQQAIDHPSWGQRNNPQAETQIARLLAHWRGQGWPVWHVRHDSTHPQSHYRPGQPGHAFKPEALPAAGEPVIGNRPTTPSSAPAWNSGCATRATTPWSSSASSPTTPSRPRCAWPATWVFRPGWWPTAVSPSGARTGTARRADGGGMPCRWPTWTANTAWWSRPRRCSAALPERDG